MEPVKLGLIGCGVIGRHHIRAASESPLVEVVAIADRIERRVQKVGNQYGVSKLYSEGLDRLWTPHLLENFSLPSMDAVEPVVWFGVIRAVTLVVSLIAKEAARRRVDTNRSAPIARALMLDAALIVVALAGFGLTRDFWIALMLFWLVGTLRSIIGPLYATWFNLRIDDPQVRATMFSISSQVDAIGQIGGGPGVGVIGNASIRAALVVSALLLSPVLPLYTFAMRRGRETEAAEVYEPECLGS